MSYVFIEHFFASILLFTTLVLVVIRFILVGYIRLYPDVITSGSSIISIITSFFSKKRTKHIDKVTEKIEEVSDVLDKKIDLYLSKSMNRFINFFLYSSLLMYIYKSDDGYFLSNILALVIAYFLEEYIYKNIILDKDKLIEV